MNENLGAVHLWTYTFTLLVQGVGSTVAPKGVARVGGEVAMHRLSIVGSGHTLVTGVLFPHLREHAN